MSFTIDLLRPDDLLALQIEFQNLALDTSTPAKPMLVRQNATDPCYLIFTLPQQSILEQAYFQTGNIAGNPPFNPTQPPLPGNQTAPPAGQTGGYISGDSRLVFKLPASLTSLPFTTAALLDWSGFELVVSPLADGKISLPPITAPTALQTAIELPYRLIISPGSDANFVHSLTPFTYQGRTELWHTRAGQVLNNNFTEASIAAPVPLRAIYSPDFMDHGALPDPSEQTPFQAPALAPMSPNDRAQLVILTSGVSDYFVANPLAATTYTPTPFEAERLFLSTLGGWLTSRGIWPAPPYYHSTSGATVQLDLTEWSHIATQARDHYVRIVYDGFLYPFGHAATLVKVTERKVAPPDGVTILTPTAYLRQHMYIVVRERTLTYASADFTHAGRELPFNSNITIKTAVTPDIDPPAPLTAGDSTSFWIDVGGAPFQFACTATDLAGSAIDFLAPLIFMSLSEPSPAQVKSAYTASGAVCTLLSTPIAYADPGAGDTVLKTTQLYFDTELLLTGPPYPSKPFVPVLSKAQVSVPTLEHLLGTTSPILIQLYAGYLSSGLDGNAGVFAELAQSPLPISFAANKAGGLGTPNLHVTAITARKGVVAGTADDAAAGTLDPTAYFNDVNAQLFGCIQLSDLIPISSITKKAEAGPNAPVIRTEAQPNSTNPTTLVTKIEWTPQLQSPPAGTVTLTFTPSGPNQSSLTLKATVTRTLAGGPASTEVSGKLTNFTLNLLQVVTLSVTSITFTSQNGGKPDVAAQLPANNPVAFQGALGFVQDLASALPPGIFGGAAPSIDLGPTALKVSFTLGLPTINVGVFSLEHIAITTGLDLPYLDGKPAFEFAFASRSSPFLLLIECLGGGGFVHLIVDASGVQMVEGALEFGGSFSLDLGVASGSVHVLAGIYFQLKSNYTDLTGFVDIGGEVSVLGIISVSIDLNLSLSFIISNGTKTVQGRATLTISVHIIFFSVSVSLSVERSFSSGNTDPKMIDVISAQQWAAYAAAFA